jgi:hypothetical protein
MANVILKKMPLGEFEAAFSEKMREDLQSRNTFFFARRLRSAHFAAYYYSEDLNQAGELATLPFLPASGEFIPQSPFEAVPFTFDGNDFKLRAKKKIRVKQGNDTVLVEYDDVPFLEYDDVSFAFPSFPYKGGLCFGGVSYRESRKSNEIFLYILPLDGFGEIDWEKISHLVRECVMADLLGQLMAHPDLQTLSNILFDSNDNAIVIDADGAFYENTIDRRYIPCIDETMYEAIQNITVDKELEDNFALVGLSQQRISDFKSRITEMKSFADDLMKNGKVIKDGTWKDVVLRVLPEMRVFKNSLQMGECCQTIQTQLNSGFVDFLKANGALPETYVFDETPFQDVKSLFT